MKYQQCQLLKRLPTGENIQVSYIPEKFAIEGKFLKLKDSKGNWEDGWQVIGVYGKPVKAPDLHKMIRGHRKQTGDSLPKKQISI